MKVHEIMTTRPRCVAPTNTLVEAAGLMRQLDVGALPVCDNEQLAGIVTDRDIVLRAVAEGHDPNTAMVSEVMSGGVEHVFADQEVEEVVRVMEQRQIRRLPVLDRGSRLVGIVSLGDVATSSNPAFGGMALRDVSEPADPTSRQRRLRAMSGPDDVFPRTASRRGPAAGGRRATKHSAGRKKANRPAQAKSRAASRSTRVHQSPKKQASAGRTRRTKARAKTRR
jgi:CBS domain-containing protein